AALLLVLVLLQPQLRRRETVVERPLVGVLVDSSQSMNDGNRSKAALEWLDSEVFRKARETCDLRYFSMDHALTETVPGEIAFNGTGSRISAGLAEWTRRWGREDAAGVVLISDGLDTGGDPPVSMDLPCWVMEVEPPGTTDVSRVAVWQVEPPRRPVAGAETSVRVVLQGWGVDGRDIPVELWCDGRKLGEKRVRFTRRADVVEAMLPLKPEKPGSYPYEIRVADPAADPSAKSQPFVIGVRQEGRSVLLLSNTIGFEGKFLRRALTTDRNVRLDSFARWQDGRWASFGDGGNAKDTLNLSVSSLASRAAVVLADVSPESLNPAQWQALSDYAGKGGGLVVLGGPNLLASPQAASSIGRILPVPTPAPHHDGRFGVKLTDAGLRHPVFGPLFEAVKDFPALQGANYASGIAGNSQVLMESIADGQSHPLVVVKQQGSGRVAVVLSDTLWRWRVGAPGWNGRLSAYDTFWSQMLDWLAPSQEGLQSGGRIELTADRSFYRQGDKVAVLAEWIGKGAAPYQTLDATIKPPAGPSRPLAMQASVWQTPEGRRVTGFRGEVSADATGICEVEVHASWQGGEADASMRFAVASSMEERRGEAPDAGFLHEVARQSHGAYFTRNNGEKWLESLPKPQRRSEREVVTDVWNHPLIATLLLACLSAEWWLRRRRGLV
ncbi:MAG: glutamine amidotransferase, partial [Verrucomicrobiota bacterium]